MNPESKPKKPESKPDYKEGTVIRERESQVKRMEFLRKMARYIMLLSQRMKEKANLRLERRREVLEKRRQEKLKTKKLGSTAIKKYSSKKNINS